LPEPSRRLFLRCAASLGALAVLSGCDIVDGESSEYALRVISTFNDRVQALLFNPNTLAPEYHGPLPRRGANHVSMELRVPGQQTLHI
jgi:hypothetical protein